VAASVLNAAHFQNEEAAFVYVESKLWADGPVCPHCGNADAKRIGRLQGKTTRLGLRKCYECKKPFTVRQGTIFESSLLPVHLWLQVIHLMCAGKKGISTNQIQRMLECSMKTAWFLTHRTREVMRDGSLAPMGGEGSTVEIDETYIGRKVGVEKKRGAAHKNAVLTLVERGGSARSFHLDGVRKTDVMPIIEANLDRASHVMIDESSLYLDLGKKAASHKVVEHTRKEYGYTDRETGEMVNTNTVEGYYSVFKRGMVGVYKHCSE
jgi:transposase-like protein